MSDSTFVLAGYQLINQKIYPTIANNYIIVELHSLIEKQINCQIINSLGTIILNRQLMMGHGKNEFNFEVGQLPKGVYFVQTDLNNATMKFVKM